MQMRVNVDAFVQGNQPLKVIVRCVNHLPVVKLLMEHGANPWTTDHKVTTRDCADLCFSLLCC